MLAEKLCADIDLGGDLPTVILAIPRGGIVVAAAMEKRTGIKADPLVIKKIPAPGNEVLTIGALAEGGEVVWEEELCQRLGVSPEYRKTVVEQKVYELAKKEHDFRGNRLVPDLAGKRVIIVDDGVATGATMKVAIESVRTFFPAEIIVVTPLISKDTLPEVADRVEAVVYLEAPEALLDLRQFYADFSEPTDEEINRLLNQ